MNKQSLLVIIVAITLLLAVLLVLWYTGKKEMAKKIILYVIIQAEREFGRGTGPLKYASVVGRIYPMLPIIIRTFVSDTQLNEWIEDGVTDLKTVLGNSLDTVQKTDPATNTTQPAESVPQSEEKPEGTSETVCPSDTTTQI